MEYRKCRLPLACGASLMWCGLVCSAASACPYSIRDSAFIGRDSLSPYRILFVVRSDTAGREQLSESVQLGSEVWLSDSNVVAQVVDLDDPQIQRLEGSLRAKLSEPGQLPAAILVSPGGAAMRLPDLTPNKAPQEAVMDTLVSVVESPARLELRDRVVRSWCVVVLVEGDDQAENDRAKRAVRAAATKITGTMTELGKVVTTGPHLLVVAPKDPREQVFLWSLGLESPPSGRSPVRVATLVARGEQRGPLLQGTDVTEEKLFACFEMMGRSCSCTTAKMWLAGSVIPLEWGPDMEAAAQDELGFDPNDPNVLMTMRSFLGRLGAASALDQGALGYREMLLPRATSAQDADGVNPDRPVTAGSTTARQQFLAPDSQLPTGAMDFASVAPGRRWLWVLVVMAATGLLAMAFATLVVLRRTPNA